MFFVWVFNPGLVDFEPVGAFTKRDEADAFASEQSKVVRRTGENVQAHVIESSFEAFREGFFRARMGVVAEILARLEVILPKVEGGTIDELRKIEVDRA